MEEENSWSAICKLQNQEYQSCNSIWAQRPDSGETDTLFDTSLKFWEPAAQMSKGGENKCQTENAFALPLHFCFFSDPP